MKRVVRLLGAAPHKRGGPWCKEARENFAMRLAFRRWARTYWPEALAR